MNGAAGATHSALSTASPCSSIRSWLRSTTTASVPSATRRIGVSTAQWRLHLRRQPLLAFSTSSQQQMRLCPPLPPLPPRRRIHLPSSSPVSSSSPFPSLSLSPCPSPSRLTCIPGACPRDGGVHTLPSQLCHSAKAEAPLRHRHHRLRHQHSSHSHLLRLRHYDQAGEGVRQAAVRGQAVLAKAPPPTV